MRYLTRFLILLALSVSACDSTDFESTWQNPAAKPINTRNESVATFLLSNNEAARRSFEYNLANVFNQHGIEATAGYDLGFNTDVTDKQKILTDLKGTGIDHAVFMRIVDRQLETSYIPGAAWYPGFYYDPFLWYHGAYVGPWGLAGTWPAYYDPGYYRVDTVVSVETLVYSVPDTRLDWAGLSRTMNPSKVKNFVEDVVSEALKEMKKTGLIYTT